MVRHPTARALSVIAVLALPSIAFIAGRSSVDAQQPAPQNAVPTKQAVEVPAAVAPRAAANNPGSESAPLEPKGRYQLANPVANQTVELDDAQMEALRALGYEPGSTAAPAKSGAAVLDAARIQPGLNLVTDGHRAAASIMDVNGRALHTWALSFEEAFPSDTPSAAHGWTDQKSVSFWRRVHLLPGGDLLAIFEGVSLIKIDRDSKLLWTFPRAHHDIEVLDDGTIYTLTREVAPLPPQRKDKKPSILTDDIVVLDADGNELKRVSIFEAIERSPYAGLLENVNAGVERFHTNTIEWLDGSLADRIPAFARGNVLISFRIQDAIAVVDLEAKQVVWASAGMWLKQHQPTVTDQGTLLIFDNLGNRGQSRVLEVDPTTQQIVWSYGGRGEKLFSLTCGSNQRLANGNTLITESDAGRAIEVTRDREIVWEYVTPHRAGAENELIATLFEVIRLPVDAGLDWMREPSG